MIWYIYYIQCQMRSTNNIKMNTYWTMMIGSQTYINIYSHRFTSIVWPSRTHKSKGHYLLVWTNSNNGPKHINHIHEHKVSTPKHLKHQMVQNTHKIQEMIEVGWSKILQTAICVPWHSKSSSHPMLGVAKYQKIFHMNLSWKCNHSKSCSKLIWRLLG